MVFVFVLLLLLLFIVLSILVILVCLSCLHPWVYARLLANTLSVQRPIVVHMFFVCIRIYFALMHCTTYLFYYLHSSIYSSRPSCLVLNLYMMYLVFLLINHQHLTISPLRCILSIHVQLGIFQTLRLRKST